MREKFVALVLAVREYINAMSRDPHTDTQLYYKLQLESSLGASDDIQASLDVNEVHASNLAVVRNLYEAEIESLKQELADALGRGNAQVEDRKPSLGEQVGTQGDVPAASSGDHAIGEGQGAAGEPGVQA